MAVPFQTIGYELNNGDVGALRVAADLASECGPSVPLNGTEEAHVYVNKSNRRYGVRARYALYFRLIGSPSDGARKYKRVPKTTQAALDSSAGSISYGGFSWTLASTEPEDAN